MHREFFHSFACCQGNYVCACMRVCVCVCVCVCREGPSAGFKDWYSDIDSAAAAAAAKSL